MHVEWFLRGLFYVENCSTYMQGEKDIVLIVGTHLKKAHFERNEIS